MISRWSIWVDQDGDYQNVNDNAAMTKEQEALYIAMQSMIK
jgi:hypothetical protein